MKLDIVVPFFNEEACIEKFYRSLADKMDRISKIECRYYFIDDGSQDGTPDILKKLALEEQRIHVLTLLWNHGHQKALIAGLDACKGDAVLMMDGDGQHPAAVAAEMVNLAIENKEIAMIQAIRREGQGGKFKEWSSRLFYWIMNRAVPELHLERGASDFRVIRKETAEIIKAFPDRYQNLRVLLSTIKLPTITVHYTPMDRIAGSSKYSWRKMLNLAADGIFTFSALPLRLSIFLMVGTGLLGFGYTLYGLAVYLQSRVVPGWTSVIALVGLVSSAVFAVLAIMAQYIRRIYEDVQGHPIYIRRPELQNQNEDRTSS